LYIFAEKQWRVGTPKTRSTSKSPLSLNDLRLVLKVVKMDMNKTPAKRKASKSVPDEGEVENKRSKTKVKIKQPKRNHAKEREIKPFKSPKQTYGKLSFILLQRLSRLKRFHCNLPTHINIEQSILYNIWTMQYFFIN
jgi:hypothetical protein